MRKPIIGAVAIVAALGAALLFTWPVAAQDRPFNGPDALILEGIGSSIGVSIRDLTTQEASGDAARGGVFIEQVGEDTPAARAGFEPGDIVLEFDGERIRSARQFARLVRETPPGRPVSVSLRRGGSRQTLNVTPDTRRTGDLVPDLAGRIERSLRRLPRNLDFDFDFDVDVQGNRAFAIGRGRLGVSLSTLGPQLAEYFGVKEGALVTSVEADSIASRAGLRAGDVITSIGGTAVQTPADVTREVRQIQQGGMTEIRVMREKKEMSLTVTAPERPAPRRTIRGVSA